MKTILNPFETNLNWNMRDFEKNKLKGIILENLIYTLEKTYRNGNDMICSIDINGKKIERQFWKWTWNSESVKPLSQSKCFTCIKPQQKHSTVNNFKHKYDFLNIKKLDLKKICFLSKKKNNSWHSKDIKTKNWQKTNFEAEKDRKLIKELTKCSTYSESKRTHE